MANHNVILDDGQVFQVIPATRKILVPAGYRIIGAVNDHNSEQVTFKCPKFIDGHNIAECAKKFVVWENARGDRDRDLLGDHTTDEEYVYFRWTISDLITAAAGYIKFAVSFEDTENGKTIYNWSTATCTECQVIDTLTAKSPSRVEGSIPEGYAKIAENGLSISSNGSHSTLIQFEDGTTYAYPKVNISVPNAEPKLYSETFAENGTYYPENGNDGFDKVIVDVVPETEVLEEEITKENMTQNGVYEKTPTAGKYFSEVKLTPKMQGKSVWVKASGESIEPDAGYCGLSKVTVNLATTAPKYQTDKVADRNNINITPDEGYDALAQVTVAIPTESPIVTPSKESQTIEPQKDGGLLAQVVVNPIPGEYIKPSGSVEITSNGDGQDVSQYAKVNVRVPSDAKPEYSRTVTLNFAEGDMGIIPNVGMVFSGITIFKPDTLKPENIRAGVTIAGISGTYTGESSGDDGGDTGEKMYVGRTSSSSISNLSALKDQGSTVLESTTWNFTTSGNGYLYLCIPASRSVTVKQSGFDVTLTNGGNFSINGVKYIAYRTGTPQVADSYVWNITIY